MNLQTRDQMIAYFAAMGHTNAQIAEALDLDISTVRLKLTDERMQFEIKHLRYKLYGKDHKKRFNDILPHAIDVTETILKDPGAKQATRFAAAQEVFDRALGKPKQTVEHEGSLVRALIEKLEETKNVSPVLDIPVEQKTFPAENSILDATTSLGVIEDPIDSWVNKNIR